MQRANYVWIHLREVAENGLHTIGSDRIVSLCLARLRSNCRPAAASRFHTRA